MRLHVYIYLLYNVTMQFIYVLQFYDIKYNILACNPYFTESNNYDLIKEPSRIFFINGLWNFLCWILCSDHQDVLRAILLLTEYISWEFYLYTRYFYIMSLYIDYLWNWLYYTYIYAHHTVYFLLIILIWTVRTNQNEHLCAPACSLSVRNWHVSVSVKVLW